MDPQLAELLRCLDLAPDGEDAYTAVCEQRPHGTIFGGQVLAQGLLGAGLTAAGRPAHSLQALFLKRGSCDRDVRLEVERLRDGRSFSARRVSIRQGDDLLAAIQVSFHEPEPGYERPAPAPEVPDPESLPSANDAAEELAARFPGRSALWAGLPRPMEFRQTVVPSFMGGDSREPSNIAWFRAKSPLPDDPLLHQCMLAYASDCELNDNALRPHNSPDQPDLVSMASLDHAMWFHAPARADDWILFLQESPFAGSARGFARGTMHTRDGRLVASLGQDSLMRPQRA